MRQPCQPQMQLLVFAAVAVVAPSTLWQRRLCVHAQASTVGGSLVASFHRCKGRAATRCPKHAAAAPHGRPCARPRCPHTGLSTSAARPAARQRSAQQLWQQNTGEEAHVRMVAGSLTASFVANALKAAAWSCGLSHTSLRSMGRQGGGGAKRGCGTREQEDEGGWGVRSIAHTLLRQPAEGCPAPPLPLPLCRRYPVGALLLSLSPITLSTRQHLQSSPRLT